MIKPIELKKVQKKAGRYPSAEKSREIPQNIFSIEFNACHQDDISNSIIICS